MLGEKNIKKYSFFPQAGEESEAEKEGDKAGGGGEKEGKGEKGEKLGEQTTPVHASRYTFCNAFVVVQSKKSKRVFIVPETPCSA